MMVIYYFIVFSSYTDTDNSGSLLPWYRQRGSEASRECIESEPDHSFAILVYADPFNSKFGREQIW